MKKVIVFAATMKAPVAYIDSRRARNRSDWAPPVVFNWTPNPQFSVDRSCPRRDSWCDATDYSRKVGRHNCWKDHRGTQYRVVEAKRTDGRWNGSKFVRKTNGSAI